MSHTTLVRLLSFLSLAALAAPPIAAQRLIVANTTPGTDPVYEMDVITGAFTQIATSISANNGVPASFSYDYVAGVLYSSDTATDNIFTIDVTNWEATLVGNLGAAAFLVHAIEVNPLTGLLYGISQHDSSLYQIDIATGAPTLIGSTGLPISSVNGFSLAYSPIAQQMFLVRRGLPDLYTIDLTNAAISVVGAHNIPNVGDMTFSIDDGNLYAIDNITDDAYSIDPTTGAATLIAHVTLAGVVNPNVISMAYIPGAGRITRAAHACGPTTITPRGVPAPGGLIEVRLGGFTAFPAIGIGFTAVGAPFCGCVVGHEWALALFGSALQFNLPANPAYIGLSLHLQGLDFLGAGGCADPLLTLTDTITVTIG